MGFIKAIEGAATQFKETYREVIKYDKFNDDILVKMVTTESGQIQDQSRLFVQPGQCAIYTDQGAIKDIITEPGMYFMDTSAPTLFQLDVFTGLGQTIIETLKRIAYEGDQTFQQKVYFIDLTEKIGLKFGTVSPIIYNDPEWGPIEVKVAGNYAIKVNNPVNLLANVVGPRSEFYVDGLTDQVRTYILSQLSSKIGTLGVSFTELAAHQPEIAKDMLEAVNENFTSMGIAISQLAIMNITVPDEVKEAMRERTSIKMKATSVNNEEADIYTKLNTAEAIKDMANNSNNNGTTIMGMNMGNTLAGVVNNNIENATNNNQGQQ
jgi:membrane protease subunit (stomatin/prohibitin family)